MGGEAAQDPGFPIKATCKGTPPINIILESLGDPDPEVWLSNAPNRIIDAPAEGPSTPDDLTAVGKQAA